MAHFAELDSNNIVLRVIVVANEALEHKELPDSETHALEYIHQWFGKDTIWKQTSYNGNFRRHFAGIGYTYDAQRDAFIPPKPYASWTLNEDTCNWECPVAYPTEGGPYTWNETTKAWDAFTPSA